ncbi:MAG: hypothetical protein AVDCRST_MAG68-5670, partial [uncultured Gemmatimonadetes bacterium]
ALSSTPSPPSSTGTRAARPTRRASPPWPPRSATWRARRARNSGSHTEAQRHGEKHSSVSLYLSV